MAARGEEWSLSTEIELTLGSDCHITSAESDGTMANGPNIAENGNLQVCGSKYTGAKESIKGDGGREGGNSNPEDPGSIQHDNEKASGRDDTKGDQNFNSDGKE
ncbi:uncharacterized protein LOC124260852 [Haliotis rubra]|uniref:uncharacterized protein LOC124260852 n=1 Tax=Haliotis rubra TaxID=36100 RepID=UPI001EE513A1|nr:uncharacterized protein LOC124260852 [Haliotis rubra]